MSRTVSLVMATGLVALLGTLSARPSKLKGRVLDYRIHTGRVLFSRTEALFLRKRKRRYIKAYSFKLEEYRRFVPKNQRGRVRVVIKILHRKYEARKYRGRTRKFKVYYCQILAGPGHSAVTSKKSKRKTVSKTAKAKPKPKSESKPKPKPKPKKKFEDISFGFETYKSRTRKPNPNLARRHLRLCKKKVRKACKYKQVLKLKVGLVEGECIQTTARGYDCTYDCQARCKL